MRHPARRAALLVLAANTSACQVVGGYDDFSQAAQQDAPEVSACARIAHSKNLAEDDRGPELLLVDNPDDEVEPCFWMDASEVSMGQYRAWLGELAGSAPAWDDALCQWKTADGAPAPRDPEELAGLGCETQEGFEEREFDPFADEKPARCVDWCEAQAFCNWSGKRLCYGYSLSGALDPTHRADEWRIACSAQGELAFPFPVDSSATCNYEQPVAGCGDSISGVNCGPWEVDSHGLCRPGPGLPSHLGGNVEEWIHLCDREDSAQASCQARGGSYDSPREELACAGALPHHPRSFRSTRLGFRCCAALTAQERSQIVER